MEIYNNAFSLSGKMIIVTGASSGIGKACAIECAKMGAHLVIVGRDRDRLSQTLNDLHGNGHQEVIADITTEEGLRSITDAVEKVDGLILNAGINPKALVKFVNGRLLDDVFSVNVFSPILTVQKLIKTKKLNKGGSIVLISSIASFYASVSNSVYSASKGAVNSFMRVLALELAPQKIRVNAIQPGMVKTKMMEAYPIQEELDVWEKTYPLGRFGEPEDIANACIYLLSDASNWVTGSVLTVDGGVTLR